MKRLSRIYTTANTTYENNIQSFTQNVRTYHEQLGDAKSEISDQISSLAKLVSAIDHRMEAHFSDQETIPSIIQQFINSEDSAIESLRQIKLLLNSPSSKKLANQYEQFEPPLGRRNRPLWKRVTLSRNYKKYDTRFGQIYVRTRLIRLCTNKALGDFDFDENYETETSLRIHPNLWFFKTAFSISCIRSNYSRLTNLHFQVHNTRPHDALIFEFCSSGNLNGVKSLIARKDASPFDVDADGWTPLHVRSPINLRLHSNVKLSTRPKHTI